jgi:hypothetical protein
MKIAGVIGEKTGLNEIESSAKYLHQQHFLIVIKANQ